MSTRRLPAFATRLRLPVIAAPMFLVSGPELVIAAARAGIVGAFPAPNARAIDDYERWCARIADTVAEEACDGAWAASLITHSSYARLAEELEIVGRYRPPLVITALGSPGPAVETVHDYGGHVFADVSTPQYAEKALAAGADGLVLLCAGAGGHTGTYSPFAFVREVRAFFDGPLVVSGAIADGHAIRAVEALGADLAYVGTRFIAATESLASDANKAMIVESSMTDIVLDASITGVAGNWMAGSLARLREVGYERRDRPDFADLVEMKAWKHIWAAGHGVGQARAVTPLAAIVEELAEQYAAAPDA